MELIEPEPRKRARVEQLLIALIVLGTIARFGLSAISYGTQDITTWHNFGKAIAEKGLLKNYVDDGAFNHPPIAGEWARLAYVATTSHPRWFPFVFKLPAITSDILVCLLLVRIWRWRGASERAALGVAALFAWNLDAILVSAHHGNTDSIYAMLALLAADAIARRGWNFVGGLALGAAINVKLIPVLLILPMIVTVRPAGTIRPVLAFFGGLLVGTLPFVPIIAREHEAFARNVLNYPSLVTDWGLNYILRESIRQPKISGFAEAVLDRFHDVGRFLLIAVIALLTLFIRRRNLESPERRFDSYESAAMTAALFLILASGFGVQYTVFVAPLMFAVVPRTATLYGLLAGIYLFFEYWIGWQGKLPIDSTAKGPMNDRPAPLFALLAWALLIVFVRDVIQQRHQQRPRIDPASS